jgi:5-formyltetrahydrofolate cyclo-ligase
MANKSEIRTMMKAVKNEFEPMMISFAGEVIGYKVMAMEEYKNADTIFIYADYNREVPTSTIIADALKTGKKVALPKVYKQDLAKEEIDRNYMKFHYITSMEDLEQGYNGIREPKEELPVADYDTEGSVMIMPLMAFDAKRNRVGYGAGFYDRYLNSHKVAYKIGIAYDEQKVDNIDDRTEYDVRPDVIVTQKAIYN